MQMFIEHRFATLKSVFKLLGSSKVLHIGDDSIHAIFTTLILFNCHTCIRGSGNFFNINPPLLEEYLPLDEELPHAPSVTVPDYYVHGNTTT